MTEKLIFFFRCSPGLTQEEFGRLYLEEHVPLVLQHTPRLRRYVVNVVEAEGEDDPERFHAAVELRFDSVDDYLDPQRLYDTEEGRAAVERSRAHLVSGARGYHVTEHVQRDYERTWAEGERSPGSKLIAALYRADGLTRDGFVEHWTREHSRLAMKHVLGMSRYVTNVVVSPLTEGAPEIDGIVEVHYLEERSFDSEEGRRIITEDTQRLLQPPVRHMTAEYVIRA